MCVIRSTSWTCSAVCLCGLISIEWKWKNKLNVWAKNQSKNMKKKKQSMMIKIFDKNYGSNMAFGKEYLMIMMIGLAQYIYAWNLPTFERNWMTDRPTGDDDTGILPIGYDDYAGVVHQRTCLIVGWLVGRWFCMSIELK